MANNPEAPVGVDIQDRLTQLAGELWILRFAMIPNRAYHDVEKAAENVEEAISKLMRAPLSTPVSPSGTPQAPR